MAGEQKNSIFRQLLSKPKDTAIRTSSGTGSVGSCSSRSSSFSAGSSQIQHALNLPVSPKCFQSQPVLSASFRKSEVDKKQFRPLGGSSPSTSITPHDGADSESDSTSSDEERESESEGTLSDEDFLEEWNLGVKAPQALDPGQKCYLIRMVQEMKAQRPGHSADRSFWKAVAKKLAKEYPHVNKTSEQCETSYNNAKSELLKKLRAEKRLSPRFKVYRKAFKGDPKVQEAIRVRNAAKDKTSEKVARISKRSLDSSSSVSSQSKRIHVEHGLSAVTNPKPLQLLPAVPLTEKNRLIIAELSLRKGIPMQQVVDLMFALTVSSEFG